MIVVDSDQISDFFHPDHGNGPVAEPAIGPSKEQKAPGPPPEGLKDLGALSAYAAPNAPMDLEHDWRGGGVWGRAYRESADSAMKAGSRRGGGAGRGGGGGWIW